MKLRKATKVALLDLDDPLETDSDFRAYESGECEYSSSSAGVDEDIIIEAAGGTENDDEEDAAARDDEHDTTKETSYYGSPSGPSNHLYSSTRSESATQGGEDLKDQARVKILEEHEDGEEAAGLGEDDEGADFNPFAILAETCCAGCISCEDDSQPDSHASAAWHEAAHVTLLHCSNHSCKHGELNEHGEPQAGGTVQRRHRKQRLNPRRRRRCGAAPAALLSASPPQPQVVPNEILSPMPPDYCLIPSIEDSVDRDTDDIGSVSRSRQDYTESTCGGCGKEEEDAPECWLCYGKGQVVEHNVGAVNGGGGGASTSVPAATATAGGASGGEGTDFSADDEMVVPCRTCSGGLRYIHRGCFKRWLESSWALTCPNCRTMYDSGMLEAFSDRPSVLAMFTAACPPSHDLSRPFLLRTVVYFCIGGAVELSMACGGMTAAELLRRIRLLVDDVAAVGGDGGLGLVGPEGRALQIPSFEVTGLTFEIEGDHSGEIWGPSTRNWRPFHTETDQEEENEYDVEHEHQEGSMHEARNGEFAGPLLHGVGGRGGGGGGGGNSTTRAGPRFARQVSTSAYESGDARADTSTLYHFMPFNSLNSWLDVLEDWSAGSSGLTRHSGIRVPTESTWEAPDGLGVADPPLWAPPQFRDLWRRELRVRSLAADDRERNRVAQQRRRAEMQQQRNQQRYPGGSRGQHPNAWTPLGRRR